MKLNQYYIFYKFQLFLLLLLLDFSLCLYPYVYLVARTSFLDRSAHLMEAAGEEVWLVTAAPEDMAVLMAKRLGFTGALGSKAETKDGKYTGAMLGLLLHGKEKAVAVRELAQKKNLDLSQCYSYSDSHNDFPLLQCVGHPSAINPDAILSLRAMAEGWPIHDFRRARYLGKIVSPVVVRLAALGTWLTPRRKRR